MIANEVRIGNWVLVPMDGPVPIPVYAKRIRGISLFGEYDFTEPSYPENHIVGSKHCTGILITSKLLESIGFSKRSKKLKTEYFIDCTPSRNKEGFEYELVFSESESDFAMIWRPKSEGLSHYFPCIYLHQLQNLYFALTGKELEINLE
jgi:hypothetical protein